MQKEESQSSRDTGKQQLSRKEFLKASAGTAALWALAGTGLSGVAAGRRVAGGGDFADRAAALIAKMTPEEKIGQLRYEAPAIPRLDVPAYNWWNECLHGVGRAGYATVFPQAIGMAATWDAPLFGDVADAIATEARAKHQAFVAAGRRDIYMGLTFWTPNINIVRDPRWGRGQETYGEDPWLTGQLANAFIRGLQGDDPTYHKVIATSKHFAVYNGPEPLRHQIDVEVSDRDLYETYLPAFETTVRDAGVASVMCAYNSFRGMPCCGSNPLLKTILRRDWDFDGYVVSDCWAINDFYMEGRHGTSETAAQAAALALKTGTDLNCGNSYPHLKKALAEGIITEADLDRALQRLFEARFKLGMFDDPEKVPYSDVPYAVVDSPAHRELALQMARESIVLLKNEPSAEQNQPLLPLSKELDSLAVIGPNADNYWTMLGNYHGTPAEAVTPLQGLRESVGEATKVTYAQGSDFADGIPTLTPIDSQYLRPAEGEGSGLYGEYYDNQEWQGPPAIQRVDPEVDFIWRDDTPVTGQLAEPFSVRWRGQLKAPETGTYAIGMNGFNFFRLKFEGEKKVEYSGQHSPWYDYFEADLQAGQTYNIEIEFYSYGPDPQAQLVWQKPGRNLLEEARQAARASEAVVLCLGLSPRLEGEEMDIDVKGFNGGDKSMLRLPAPQRQLMKEIHSLGKPTVLVLMSGSAVALNWADEHIPAILQGWYGGQAGGTALAEVLFGDYNPGGRLPVTFYKSVEDLPAFTNYDMEGRTYKYFKGEPLYPFGHGLSYTSFDYQNLQVSGPVTAGPQAQLKLSVDVTNTGEQAGEEVVQLYLREPVGYSRRNKELKGFRRLALAPGQTRTVAFTLESEALAQWDEQAGQKVVTEGSLEVQIGRSASDIAVTQTVNVVA